VLWYKLRLLLKSGGGCFSFAFNGVGLVEIFLELNLGGKRGIRKTLPEPILKRGIQLHQLDGLVGNILHKLLRKKTVHIILAAVMLRGLGHLVSRRVDCDSQLQAQQGGFLLYHVF